MLRLVKRLYELPPKDVLRKAMRRLHRQEGATVEEIVDSPKLMRAQWPYDFLSRYEAILERTVGWRSLDFAGRDVLELGCGPLLGWGPYALFRGARRFVAVDPAADSAAIQHPLVVERYLLRLWKDLCAIYGPLMSFEDLRRALASRCEGVAAPLVEAPLSGSFDIVLSNSCLEHIVPLDATLVRLAALQAPDCRFIHLVDFGNHRSTRNPFDGVYDRPPADYVRRGGQDINLLRAPDVMELFAAAGIAARLVPYYSFAEHASGPIVPEWRERYDDDALFLKAALIVSDR